MPFLGKGHNETRYVQTRLLLLEVITVKDKLVRTNRRGKRKRFNDAKDDIGKSLDSCISVFDMYKVAYSFGVSKEKILTLDLKRQNGMNLGLIRMRVAQLCRDSVRSRTIATGLGIRGILL
jgi:hypothetical protein